jgi:hypothetical protein
MKVYLIVALFLGALVVAHSLEEEEEKVELPEQGEFKQSSRIYYLFRWCITAQSTCRIHAQERCGII